MTHEISSTRNIIIIYAFLNKEKNINLKLE